MGEFDDTPIREFSQDKEILQIRDHLLIRNEIPYLVLVIKYYPFRVEAQASHSRPFDKNNAISSTSGENRENRPPAENWRKDLGDADLALFNRLRDWRSERCKKDGVPPYLIFTNAQLAGIAKLKPQSLTGLASVDGVGRGKIDRYGPEVLEITAKPPETISTPATLAQSSSSSPEQKDLIIDLQTNRGEAPHE
jgi:ATP-dependent DNA helicase RecQ